MPRTLLGSISVSKPTGGKNAAMLLHLPHGLFNPAGVTMGIDAAKRETFASAFRRIFSVHQATQESRR